MPQYNSFISANIDAENFSRLAKDIASNQQLDDDIQMHRYEMMERFGAPNILMNRHNVELLKQSIINLIKEEND